MNNNELRFSLTMPLNNGDTEDQTYGCRAYDPSICKNCYAEGICAFASSDNICKTPSVKWKKYYHALLGVRE